MSTLLLTIGLLLFVSLFVAGLVAFAVFLKIRPPRPAAGVMVPLAATLPPRIHLVPRPAPTWNDAAQVGALVEPLLQRGFRDAGAYSVREMEFLRLRALVHPEEGLYAAVYEHGAANVWLDLVSVYADGTTLTYSTTRQGRALDQRPGHGKVLCPDFTAERLLEKLLANRPRRPLGTASAERFADDFEAFYAAEMDWRNLRGGLTEDEIRSMAEASGLDLSDEEFQATQHHTRRQAMAALRATLLERFAAEHPGLLPPGVEEARLLVVHDRLPHAEVAALAGQLVDDEWMMGDGSDGDEEPPSLPTRRAFAAMNEQRPEAERFRKLGEVSEPVPADVYLAPETDKGN